MSDALTISLSVAYEALHGPITWLGQLPAPYFIGVAAVFVVVAAVLRDTLAFLWACLCCLVIIGALATADNLRLIFILFVGASSLLVLLRERFRTARTDHVVRQMGQLQERVERLEFAVQNQFIRSLKDLKRPAIAPGIAPMTQDQNSEGSAHDARHGAQHSLSGNSG